MTQYEGAAAGGSPHQPPAPARPGPTPTDRRAVAPDLARGLMLLLIAMAHVPWFLYTTETSGALAHAVDGGVADRIAQGFTITVVDGRVYPLFALLFAYGIGQIHARELSHGADPRQARRLLRVRNLWLLVFGLVHAALLWQGDILGVYGLMGLVMVPLFLTRPDRILTIWIWVLLGVGAGFYLLYSAIMALALATGGIPEQLLPRGAIENPDYLSSIPQRLAEWALSLPASFLTFTLPAAFLLGLLLARHRVLEQPARHRRRLRWAAIVGIAVGWAFGALTAAAQIGALPGVDPLVLSGLHTYTGLFAGVGYAALFGLIAHRMVAGPVSLPARAVISLGRRSLSGYLAQSLVFVVLLSAAGFTVGAQLSSWSALLVAIGTWLVTVVAAHLADRAGRRGPAETLLRRLTYGSVRDPNG